MEKTVMGMDCVSNHTV